MNDNEPIFKLPPFTVEKIFTGSTEVIDWGLQCLGIPELWKQTKGDDVKIAVLDTGVCRDHPDLINAIADAKDFTKSKSGVADVCGHSTHCCGIIAARENREGVIGVAPRSKLYVGKVLDDKGNGSEKSIIQGIEWAISNKVDIISMSLGSDFDSNDIHNAVKLAFKNNIIIVSAAGNDGPQYDTVDYPARYQEVISVGAIDRRKRIASFSSRGKKVDVVAPGDRILSCYPPHDVAVLSGTSMATPMVAGVLALMLSRCKNNNIKIEPPDAIRHLLINTAVDLGSEGFDTSYGYGLINPQKLLLS